MGCAWWWSDERSDGGFGRSHRRRGALGYLGVVCSLLVTLACDASSAEKLEGYASRAPSAPPSLKTPSALATEVAAVRETCPKEKQEVALTTDDDISLIADFYPTGEQGAPAVILLHMIPPHHDRSNYPAGFIDELQERGLAVLNLNRRGAEGSGGVAEDAYKGDKGWLDVKAGRDFLVRHVCATPPAKVAIVGASNGTTSALDFTVRAGASAGEAAGDDAAGDDAAADDSLTPPAALVFLSGGKYTEAQHKLDDHAGLLDPIPILFAFPRKEAAWSRRAARRHRDASWTVQEYAPGAHGTGLFESDPASVTLVAEHLAAALTGASVDVGG